MVEPEGDGGTPAKPEMAQVQEPAPVVEPSLDVKQPPESYLKEPEAVQEDRPATRVPVGELQKERKRRQEAERELAELKAQKEQEVPEVDVSADLANLGDEEFIDKKTVLPLIQKVKETTKREVMAELQQQRETENQNSQKTEASRRIAESEQQARAQFPDYDATVQAAIKAGGFLPEEIASIRRSSNPGAVLYRKSKEVTATLGISVQQPKPNQQQPANPEPEKEDLQTEEDIFQQVYGAKNLRA
jgi:hypothetical protein